MPSTKSKKPKFKRPENQRGGSDRTDERGKVIILVKLEDPEKKAHHALKGNITKTLAVEGVTVSEVHARLEDLLYDE